MTRMDINGIHLNYEVSGSGEPLVLIGGLTANCREWLRMSDSLARQFTVYKPENRGAGQTTGWAPELSVEQMAHDIAMFIETLGIERAYVVGHSMGGAILQQLCIHHPKRVKAAIIASSFAHFPKASQLYIENTSELFAAGLTAELVLRTIYTRLYGSDFLSNEAHITSEFQRMLTDPVPQTPEGYRAQVHAIGTFDSRAELNKIQCPTLIINGTEDLLTPTYLSEELHQGIRHSKLNLIPKCGHMLPQENPKHFTQCIMNFFKE
jgi:3-oxoadipate enol-lactonase